MLRIQLLGGLSVQNEREIVGAGGQRKSLLVLAMIAAAPNGGITREKLLGYFWPDAAEERAQNSLRQRLFSLRRDLGEDELFVGSSQLRLNPLVASVDLWEFERAVAERDYDRAAAAYGGPFLDGIYLKDAPEVERWIQDRRDALGLVAHNAMTTVARGAEERGDLQLAIAVWRRQVASDATAAAPAAGLIRALANAGDTRAALSHYRVYCTMLRDEFGIEPDPQVVALVDSIRDASRTASTAIPTTPNATPLPVPTEAVVDAAVVAIAESAPATIIAATAATRLATPRRKSWLLQRILLGGVALVTVASAIMFNRQPGASAARLDQKRVLVLQFRNETGDPAVDALGEATASAVSSELSRNGIADVIDSRTSVREPAANAAASPRDIARQLQAGTIVSGAFALRNDSIFADAAVTDVQSGVIRQAVQATGVPRDSASLLVARIRGKVAGTLASLQDDLFMQVAGSFIEPPNIEAYREFSAGLLKASQGDWEKASSHFHEALRLDSTFVLAALWAAHNEGGDEYRRLTQFVQQHRGRLAELDQAHLDYLVAWRARDLQTAFEATDRMVKSAPESFTSLHAHGKIALEMRRFDEAARTYARVDLSRRGPDRWADFYEWATEALHQVHDFRKELALWEAAARQQPSDPRICTGKLRALVALGRLKEIANVVDRCAALGPPDAARGRLTISRRLAKELLVHGHRTTADSVWGAAIALAEELSAAHRPFDAFLADIYYEAGRYDAAAPALIRDVLDDTMPRPVKIGMAAVAAARSGDTTTARVLRNKLEALPPVRPKLLALSWLNMAENKHEAAISNLQEFEHLGGLIVQQLYAERLYEPLWHRSEWKALFRPR